ncbi:MAG: hypothetical protein NXI16_04680 [Alphaproteobacteria bacterium]|nr:hypothetical protein [Alphaproteobacteria bacterium]
MTPIVVRSKADMLTALDATPAGQPVFAVPAEALGTLGGPTWAAIDRQVREERPDRNFRLVVDAEASPGEAMAALEAGCAAVRFTGPKSVADKLADIASAKGAMLMHDPDGVFFPTQGRSESSNN